MEEHQQQILQLLLKEESEFDKHKNAYCELDIKELLFPELSIGEIRIIMNNMCKAHIEDNDIIKSSVQDTGRNPLMFIRSNIYTKPFFDAGGFIEIKKQEEEKINEYSKSKEQEQRIKDLTEKKYEKEIWFYENRFYISIALLIIGAVITWSIQQIPTSKIEKSELILKAFQERIELRKKSEQESH